jgi:hypothetical protein
MSQPEEIVDLRLRPRPTTTVTISVPVDTLDALKRVAAERDMTVEALVKLYVGQGLRHDLARMFADRVLEVTEQVLSRHGQSQEQIDAIMREIRDTSKDAL